MSAAELVSLVCCDLGAIVRGRSLLASEFEERHGAGVGWVPVDIGSAMIGDESSDGLEFFGTDNADFLVMHLDTDLES